MNVPLKVTSMLYFICDMSVICINILSLSLSSILYKDRLFVYRANDPSLIEIDKDTAQIIRQFEGNINANKQTVNVIAVHKFVVAGQRERVAFWLMDDGEHSEQLLDLPEEGVASLCANLDPDKAIIAILGCSSPFIYLYGNSPAMEYFKVSLILCLYMCKGCFCYIRHAT